MNCMKTIKVCKRHGLTAFYVTKYSQRCVICHLSYAKRYRAAKSAARRKRQQERRLWKSEAPIVIPGVCTRCKGPRSLRHSGLYCITCAKSVSDEKQRQPSEDLKWHVTWERIQAAFERRRNNSLADTSVLD